MAMSCWRVVTLLPAVVFVRCFSPAPDIYAAIEVDARANTDSLGYGHIGARKETSRLSPMRTEQSSQRLAPHSAVSSLLSRNVTETTRVAYLVKSLMECAIREDAPIFARAGFLLGIIRHGGFIPLSHAGDPADLDLDIGYLQEDREATVDFLMRSPCLLKLLGSTFIMSFLYRTNACNTPDPSADLHDDSNIDCSRRSENGGFDAWLGKDHLSLQEFIPNQKCDYWGTCAVEGGDDAVMISQDCDAHVNCESEIRLFYGEYGHSRERRPEFHFGKDWFRPWRTEKFYGVDVRVPHKAEEYLTEIYGLNWRSQAFNKHDPASVARPMTLPRPPAIVDSSLLGIPLHLAFSDGTPEGFSGWLASRQPVFLRDSALCGWIAAHLDIGLWFSVPICPILLWTWICFSILAKMCLLIYAVRWVWAQCQFSRLLSVLKGSFGIWATWKGS